MFSNADLAAAILLTPGRKMSLVGGQPFAKQIILIHHQRSGLYIYWCERPGVPKTFKQLRRRAVKNRCSLFANLLDQPQQALIRAPGRVVLRHNAHRPQIKR